MYDHFIITRYNLKKESWKQVQAPDDTWLDERLQIFLNYCLPSVANQTRKNFTWLLYFDTDTDKTYLNKIVAAVPPDINTEVLVCETYEKFVSQLVSDVGSIKSNHAEYLITTRLDNDDCLHPTAIQAIQDKFDCSEFQLLNFPRGFCFSPRKTVLTTRYVADGPFCSLIESYSNEIKTVMYQTHNSFNLNEVLQIDDRAYWLQIIHEKNLSNGLKGAVSYDGLEEYPFLRYSNSRKVINTTAFWAITALKKKLRLVYDAVQSKINS